MTSPQMILFQLVEAKTGIRPQLDFSLEMLQLDSLAMAELTCEIEKVFKIRLGDDVIYVTNIEELLAYIKCRL
jgi:acyl carrier protein